MELVDMTDSKSVAFKACRFESDHWYQHTKPLQSADCKGFLLLEFITNWSSNNSVKQNLDTILIL